ncbi:hypothetical protein MTR_3g096725 [Medicago truncatula]|uniref:Uncharacterized protein n=1 Tax=Medicago truncatula TaxID=3880 RepID=A0A072V1A1_MEDTR|nr:hypothetical protein MTR_3g096725 [Medicago truncatula]
MYKNGQTSFWIKFGHRKLKLGFWGEKWVFPELLSDSTSCFMFLGVHGLGQPGKPGQTHPKKTKKMGWAG